MAQPHNLRLPSSASAAFDKCEQYNQDLAKWLIYATVSTSSSAEKVCYEAMKAYNETTLREPESEWDELGFAKPADDNAEHVQAAFNKHISTVERLLQSQESDLFNSHRLYPSGFVFVDEENWEDKGVVVVHCDKDDESGEWRLVSRRIQVKHLGFVLTSLLDMDDCLENAAESCGVDSP